jgi:hypothetical protein
MRMATVPSLREWDGEHLASDYASALGQGDYAAAFALANDRLRDLRSSETRHRWIGGVAAGLITLGSGLGMLGEELTAKNAHDRLNGRILTGFGILLGLGMFGRLLFLKSPTEQLLEVWERDAKQIRLAPTLDVTTSGAVFGVSGRF